MKIGMQKPRSLLSSFLCTILLTTACGGGRTSGVAQPPASGATKVTPLGFQREAKTPTQALILGTDAAGGSTVVPLAAAARTVEVDAMWIRYGANGYEGGMTAAALETGPGSEGEVRVGIYEDVAGGAGGQWRSGVWLSSFIATTVLNKDLTDFTFSASSKGHIDGASASGLMTAGFLASMVGAAIDPSATMTGVINPDGTIGPVGGIPQKFTGAITKGKRRLGYPIGMRYAYDPDSDERVDVVALAREQGAEAIEVGDVYAAYTLLTGKQLPRPVPVDESAMAVDDETVARVEARYATWKARFDEEWARVRELSVAKRLQPDQLELAMVAAEEQAAAERLMQQGLAVSAYPRIVRAWEHAAAATAVSDVLEPAIAGDASAALAALDELVALTGTAEEKVRAIAAMKPATMGDHLRMLSAFEAAISGLASDGASASRLARVVLDDVAQMSDEERAQPMATRSLARSLSPLTLRLARGVAASAVASDTLEIEQARSIDYRCSLPNVRRLARSFSSAAGSNLVYLDALAQHATYADPDYGLARFAGAVGEPRGLLATLRDEWGEASIAWGLFALAASELSYFRTSVLISKWYSLEARSDWQGRAVSVQHEKAFMNMLFFAEVRARENARAALVATGEIPVQAKLRYEEARMLREGGVADKLAALEAYWAASSYAQTAVMLARN